MQKRTYWIVGIAAALVTAALVFVWNGRSSPDQETAAQTGDTVTAFIGDLSAGASAAGEVTARRRAALSVETPGRVETVGVAVGDEAAAGAVLMQLETESLRLNLAAAEQSLHMSEANLAGLLEPAREEEIAAAETAVVSAQAALDDLLVGPDETELALYEADVRSSEASLASASADLTGVNDSVTPAQIQAAEANLTAAEINLKNAEEVRNEMATDANNEAVRAAEQAVAEARAQLDALRAGPDTSQLATAQGSVTSAAARLEGSRADLNLQSRGATAAQIANAEAQVAQAEATLAGLVDGPTAAQIAGAEAEVEQARLSLAEAEEALAAATITAPFAGVVTAVHVAAGEYASGVVVELIDMSRLEVILEVDEIDVGALSVGQPAVITLETWPDVEIESEISLIAPGATTGAGGSLVTYDVYLRLAETTLPVRVGMTANANLITAQRTDVLLVPNAAINVDRAAGAYSVNLITETGAAETPVTVGLRDGQYTQITGGLEAGDELLTTNGAPLDSFGDEGGPPFAQ